MAQNDYIQIQDGDPGRVLLRFPLTTAPFTWPPPEELWLVTSESYAQTENQEQEYFFLGEYHKLREPTFHPTACITPLLRRSYSQIPDEDAEDMTFVARGALYTPA